MSLSRKVLLGVVILLLLGGIGVAIAGDRALLFRATFIGGGSNAAERSGMVKMRDEASIGDFGGSPSASAATNTAAFTKAMTDVPDGTVLLPRGTYAVDSTILCTGNVLFKGAGMGTAGTVIQFTNAGDGFQLGGTCTIEDVNIQTTNASAGIGLRLSGFPQLIRNIQVTKSGTGLWSKCIQTLGTVTAKLDTIYTTQTGCTTGLDIVPNGSFAVGNLVLLNNELRGVTTGMHIGGNPGALSIAMFGGAVENNGAAGILADGAGAHSLSIYGTHFEQNVTDDIKWTAGGDLSIFEANFVTGTTNAINCPDTTCTARLRVYGAIGNGSTGAVILGNAIGTSGFLLSKFRGAAFTVNRSSFVERWGNESFDATPIQNFVTEDGSGNAKINMIGGAGSSQMTMQTNTGDGAYYYFNNGIEVLRYDSAGKIRVTTGVNNSGTGLQHKRVAGCATAASLAATCTTSVAWGSNFADTSYTAVCTGDVITSGVPLNGGLTAKAVGSVTFQTVSATAAAAQYTTIDCWAAHD